MFYNRINLKGYDEDGFVLKFSESRRKVQADNDNSSKPITSEPKRRTIVSVSVLLRECIRVVRPGVTFLGNLSGTASILYPSQRVSFFEAVFYFLKPYKRRISSLTAR